MQGIAARSGEKKHGDLASKGLDPWLESVQALGPTKEAQGGWEVGGGGGGGRSRDPQKFSSQNEGLIAGAISLRTLRCRAALHTHSRLCARARTCVTCVYVDGCVWIGAARGPLRTNPHGKTSPARLHRSFASSRCFITMALGSPLAIRLPFFPPRLARLATLSRRKLDETLRTARRRLSRESRLEKQRESP